MQLIPHILLISVITIGAHLAIEEMWWTFYKEEMPQHWALKPLATCPTCMASVWGTLLHFYFSGDLLTWPIVVLGAAFTNTLLNKWVS